MVKAFFKKYFIGAVPHFHPASTPLNGFFDLLNYSQNQMGGSRNIT